MNKKSLVVLLVLVLAISGLFAKDLGIKVGGQLGWGFDIGRMSNTEADGDKTVVKAKNNGFAFNLTGEYDIDKNWGVKANFGMMFAGKTNMSIVNEDDDEDWTFDERAGLYIDFAVDAKYTYAINKEISVSGLAGLELVAGHLLKDYYSKGMVLASIKYEDSDFYNVAFGLNLGVEGSYKITDEISVVGGVTGAWFFVNSSKVVNETVEHWKVTSDKVGVASFYIRPYIGATYSL
jgi:hypothetical protein